MPVVRTAYDDRHDTTIEFVTLPISTVEFVDGITDPFQTVAKMSRGYGGIYSNDPCTEDEIAQAIKDMNSTKLGTPLETVEVIFLIHDVSRAFTHQQVRTRIGASFVQESMRFLGHQGKYRIMVSGEIFRNSEAFEAYQQACFTSIWTYEEMLKIGIPGEDARDILPHGICTRLFVGYAMSTLRTVYAQRMCCQAQPGQWQHILRQMKRILIEKYGERMTDMLSAPYERGEPCGYRASFDRPCTWQK